ncbi:MAG: PAS domain S-box protein, partial [Bacteroidia bacterium]|nr:PAS domain S-box protein [Bacteroidia bacterium]
SIESGIKAFELSDKINALPNKNEAAKILMQAYKKMGNMADAFKYSEIFIATKNSMYKEEKTTAIAGAEAKWQSEKKQNKIELLNKQNELQNADLKSQKLQKYAFIGGFTLLLLLAAVIFKSYRDKRKANILLSQQNAEILEKSEEIKQQNEEIHAQAEQLELTNKELEKLSIVASETDNSVVITDRKGNIEWVNDGFTKLFGFTLDEFFKEFGSNIIEASGNPFIKDIIQSCIEKRETVNYTVLNETKAGSKIWVQTTLTPILDPSGRIIKLIAIDSGITKLKEAEEEIRQQKEEIITQKDEIEQQRDAISLVNNELSEKINISLTVSTMQNIFRMPFCLQKIIFGNYFRIRLFFISHAIL